MYILRIFFFMIFIDVLLCLCFELIIFCNFLFLILFLNVSIFRSFDYFMWYDGLLIDWAIILNYVSPRAFRQPTVKQRPSDSTSSRSINAPGRQRCAPVRQVCGLRSPGGGGSHDHGICATYPFAGKERKRLWPHVGGYSAANRSIVQWMSAAQPPRPFLLAATCELTRWWSVRRVQTRAWPWPIVLLVHGWPFGSEPSVRCHQNI